MLFLVLAGLSHSAGNRTYMGQDVFVAAGQQVHHAICVFCSVQVEGEVTGRVVVLFGSLNVSGQVLGGAAVIGGNAVVDSQARVGGDVLVLDGNAVYETDEALSGNVVVLGGHLSRNSRKNQESASKRVSLSPTVFWVSGLIVLLGLLGVGFGPRLLAEH